MSLILNHKTLRIDLPTGFSLELKGEIVFLKRPNGRILEAVRYGELARRKEELEKMARQYDRQHEKS